MRDCCKALFWAALSSTVLISVFTMASPQTNRPFPAPPRYKVDPFWPKPLPNNWILGQVAGVAVDLQDHVWIIQRPASLSDDERGASLKPPLSNCCVPAPPVLEFDKEGSLVRSWGGPGEGHDWPETEHGIHVDSRGNVWIGGNGPNDHQILKFTREGKFLLQIGKPGLNGGSNAPDKLGRPAHMMVDTAAGELFVADGYLNRRVIVFDATTGAYKRHWGAYGNPPGDAELPLYTPESPQFGNPVHCVRLSSDGLVYVCDRSNNRIQVFRKSGEFVSQIVLEPQTRGPGSVWDIGFAGGQEQPYLLVADGSNNQVHVISRKTGDRLGSFGRSGRYAGQFHWVHNIAVDSLGNVYTTEVDTGKRVQKFLPVE